MPSEELDFLLYNEYVLGFRVIIKLKSSEKNEHLKHLHVIPRIFLMKTRLDN